MLKLCVFCGKPFATNSGTAKTCPPPSPCREMRRKALVRDFGKAYRQRPGVKLRERLRRSTPKYKQQDRLWRQTPKAKAAARARRSTEEYRIRERLRNQRRKAQRMAYKRTEKYKAHQRVRWATDANYRASRIAGAQASRLLRASTQKFFQLIETVNTIQKVINEQPTPNQQQG